ncbi:GntR family transcriptional regulator [Salinisphaera sp. Q1T1-3]|uniref:GntR family transcriptional regulator n=1 Tax=Salinisphaera sp. Q1T1-3 TaxID=2321229 RepID=UPI000E767586|nr:GntR family transcriptional regulator [Salinisphaera sp. Q1T1-3]RJS94852.1 GntR family transcriptional regulator [Salinisphaera sp. Q1T1-3]
MQQSTKALLRLREMILSGELGIDERLSEPRLVERIAVSRTPIRVALVRLEHEGLLEALPSGGYKIRMFDKQDIFDAIELRGTLEGLVARRAAENRPTRAALADLARPLATLDRILARERLSEDDFSHYMSANATFHDALLALAASPVLQESLTRSTAMPFASPSAFVMAQAGLPESRQILNIAQYQHHRLFEAIEAGESSRAEDLAREHARLAKRNLEVVLEHESAASQLPGLQLIKGATAG